MDLKFQEVFKFQNWNNKEKCHFPLNDFVRKNKMLIVKFECNLDLRKYLKRLEIKKKNEVVFL
jgi:hypothetical protein